MRHLRRAQPVLRLRRCAMSIDRVQTATSARGSQTTLEDSARPDGVRTNAPHSPGDGRDKPGQDAGRRYVWPDLRRDPAEGLPSPPLCYCPPTRFAAFTSLGKGTFMADSAAL